MQPIGRHFHTATGSTNKRICQTNFRDAQTLYFMEQAKDLEVFI
jgi:hypothetical protein